MHFNIDLQTPGRACGTYCLTASQVRDHQADWTPMLAWLGEA